MGLTQAEAEDLLNALKKLIHSFPISFPKIGSSVRIEATSVSQPDTTFIFDIQRKTFNIHKCTFNTRSGSTILLRVDIMGPRHQNPDGEFVDCPHIHIFRENYDDRWAYPLSAKILTNTHDLIQVLIDFMEYNHVINFVGADTQEGILP